MGLAASKKYKERLTPALFCRNLWVILVVCTPSLAYDIMHILFMPDWGDRTGIGGDISHVKLLVQVQQKVLYSEYEILMGIIKTRVSMGKTRGIKDSVLIETLSLILLGRAYSAPPPYYIIPLCLFFNKSNEYFCVWLLICSNCPSFRINISTMHTLCKHALYHFVDYVSKSMKTEKPIFWKWWVNSKHM